MELMEINILLWKIYCLSILNTILLLDLYCSSRIKEMEKQRKTYNLLSISYELYLTEQEEEKLRQLIKFYNATDPNSFIREQLFKKVAWLNGRSYYFLLLVVLYLISILIIKSIIKEYHQEQEKDQDYYLRHK